MDFEMYFDFSSINTRCGQHPCNRVIVTSCLEDVEAVTMAVKINKFKLAG